MNDKLSKFWFALMQLGVALLAVAAIWARMTEQLSGLAKTLSTIGLVIVWVCIVLAWAITIKKWSENRKRSNV